MTQKKKVKELNPDQFAKAIGFYIGLHYFKNLITLHLEETSKLILDENLEEAKIHLDKGLRLLKLERAQTQQGFEKYFRTFASSINKDIKLDRVMSPREPSSHLNLTIDFLEVTLPRLKAQMGKMREIFPGLGFRILSQAASAFETDSPNKAVFICASLPAGRGKPSRSVKWLRRAANLAQVPLTDLEVAINEVETAKSLGSEIQEIDTKLAFTDPKTETSKKLEAKKARVIQEVEKLAETAVDGDLVFQTAVNQATVSRSHPNHRTPMGAKLGLSPEQEDAMLEEGLVNIVAGAGSGKCVRGDTLVQTENGFVEIQDLAAGLKPGEERPLEMWIHGADGPEKTSHIYYHGLSETIKITTSFGYELEATPNHRIYVHEDGEVKWKYLRDFTGNELICIDIRPGMFAERSFSEEEIQKARDLAHEDLEEIPREILTAPKPVVKAFCEEVLERNKKILQGKAFPVSVKMAFQVQTLCTSLENIVWKAWRGSDSSPLLIQYANDWVDRNKIDSRWILLPLTKIEPSQCHTYDFVVPGTHSFSANGFINHNTRVLAGKVAQLVVEQGVPSNQIIATSFSRKSAHELRERIVKYGGKTVLDSGDQGIGTTHSLAMKLRREFSPSAASRPILDKNEFLIRMAMAQVQMYSDYSQEDPPVKDFFEGLVDSIPEDTQLTQTGQEVEQNEKSEFERQYQTALTGALNSIEWAINNYGGAKWALDARDAARSLMRKDPTTLSATEKAVFNKITGLDGKRKAALKQVQRAFREANLPMMAKLASQKQKTSQPKEAARKKKQKSIYWKEPANQWFNLGLRPKEMMSPDGKRQLSAKVATTQISNWKGDLKTPSQVWQEFQGGSFMAAAAVYGAYEWLKTNDPAQGKAIDYDDILIDTCKLLVGNKRVRETLQQRYQYILVDEGQDLNLCQNVLFGLIAGHIDPETREPYKDKNGKDKCVTTAKNFAYVGDDSQCSAKGTMVRTPFGATKIENLTPGDGVIVYNCGKIEVQKVNHVIPSDWTYGFEITTKAGKKLLMSPNHKIWAFTGEKEVPRGEVLLAHCDSGHIVETIEKGVYFFYRTAIQQYPNHKEYLSICNRFLPKMKACELQKGYKVPIFLTENCSSYLYLDEIISIEKKPGEFIDLDVGDASNFFGNDVLSHNSIYSFRGAKPEQFINRSDLRGGCFKTKLLATNYRSGKAIVDAANRLVEYNENRIPKTCDAFVEKNGMGVINSLSVETHEAGAIQTVEKIDELKEEIGYVGGDGKPNFGILVRTNAEAYAFAAECLKREIPFRSKLNFFTDPTTKAVLKWLALANASNTDRNVINEAVLTAHKSPGFLLDAYFEKRLQEIASSQSKDLNYLELLRRNYDNIYTGRSEWRNRNVKDYLDVLEQVFVMEGSPIEVMGQILDLRGVGFGDKPARSMKEALIEEIKKDADVMERIDEQTNGNPTDEDIELEALAPLKVILDLAMKYEDTGPFVDYIRELQDVNKRKHKKDDPNAEDYEDPAVVIDTVHGWKGLEAHHVWIAMAGGTFPHVSAEEKAAAGDTSDLEASRRLAYVAITRGQESVTVLSPKISSIGKAVRPSRFLSEACIHPMGMESNSKELDEDRMEKSASQENIEEVYDRILNDGYDDQEYYTSSDVLEEVWDYME